MKIRKIIITGLCLIISTGAYAKTAPIITEVFIDFAAGEISIVGSGFTGSEVRLGEYPTPLPLVQPVAADLVIVELPVGIDDGDYQLTLIQGKQSDEYDLTIGAVGPTGPQGDSGADGADGANGTDGTNGIDGANGADGTNGIDGANGTNGNDGIDGANGANGANGSNGTDGIDGTDGATGATGPQGEPGTSIVDGTADGQVLTWTSPNWIAQQPTAHTVHSQDRVAGSAQPYQGIHYIIALAGYFPSRSSIDPFIAEIIMFGGNFPPRGWAFCDGQLLPISQNTALFSLLGTTFGGDGRTTFGLPDLRGRVAVHPGTGPGLPPKSWGEKGGAEYHQHALN